MPVTWSVHPARKNTLKTILSLVFIVSFLLFVGFFYGIFWTVFGLVVLFVSLHAYYFPTHYELTSEEVIIKNIFTTQRRKYREFKKVYEGKNGVLLSPFRRKTFLNRFRGIFIYLPEDRARISAFLREKIEEDSVDAESQADGS